MTHEIKEDCVIHLRLYNLYHIQIGIENKSVTHLLHLRFKDGEHKQGIFDLL